MLVRSIEHFRGKKTHIRVCLDTEADLVLYPKEISRYGIEEGKDLSAETYENIIHEILIPRARKRALHLLEKQDRTIKNLSDKLKESGYPPSVIEDAIEYVRSYHYVDDERYAKNYVHYKQDGKSKRRIMQDLLQKGIDKDTAEAALLEEYEKSEEDMVRFLLEKKGYDPDNSDEKDRAKLYRYLASRGFSYDVISDAMGHF